MTDTIRMEPEEEPNAAPNTTSTRMRSINYGPGVFDALSSLPRAPDDPHE